MLTSSCYKHQPYDKGYTSRYTKNGLACHLCATVSVKQHGLEPLAKEHKSKKKEIHLLYFLVHEARLVQSIIFLYGTFLALLQLLPLFTNTLSKLSSVLLKSLAKRDNNEKKPSIRNVRALQERFAWHCCIKVQSVIEQSIRLSNNSSGNKWRMVKPICGCQKTSFIMAINLNILLS